MKILRYVATIAVALGVGALWPAQAAEKVTVYCSAEEDWCQLLVAEFSKATGIEVAMTRKSSGETFAQIKCGGTQSRRATCGGAAPATLTCRRLRRG